MGPIASSALLGAVSAAGPLILSFSSRLTTRWAVRVSDSVDVSAFSASLVNAPESMAGATQPLRTAAESAAPRAWRRFTAGA